MGLPENIKYENKVEKYRRSLRESKTAYSPGVKPTAKDISTQTELIKAEKTLASIRGKELKRRWYGDDKKKDQFQDQELKKKEEEGTLSKVLNALSIGLYGVTGVVETALGKGTKRGLIENVKANIKERGTMGDIVRSYGVNNIIAMPVGLALDIALDPITILSGGTSIAPRIAKTLLKGGGAKTLGAVVKGSLAGTAKPFVGATRYAARKAGVKSTKISKLYGDLASQVIRSTKAYEKVTGDTVEKALKASVRAEGKERWLDKTYSYLERTEYGRGLNKLFSYSPGTAIREEKAAADLARATGVPTSNAIRKTVEEASDTIFDAGVGKSSAKNSVDVAKELGEEAESIASVKKELEKTIKEIVGRIDDTKISDKILKLSNKEREQLGSLFGYYKTTVDKWDNGVARVLVNSPRSRSLLNSYAILTGMFKSAKIGANVAAPVNSIFGNAIMTTMVGVDITNRKFLSSMEKAVSIYRGNSEALLKSIKANPKWRKVVENYPELFEARLAINPKMIKDSAKFLDDAVDDVIGKMGATSGKKGVSVNLLAGRQAVKEAWKDSMAAVSTEAGSVPTTYLTEEILRGPFQVFLNKLKVLGQNKDRTIANVAAGMYEKVTVGSMEFYSKFDQFYRLGLSLHLTENGITGKEVRRLAKRMTLNIGKDISKVSDDLYKFSPLKAMEIADEAYMNYLAMPPFVKIMRTLPLVGSPFISFSYGATYNALKTGMYNPEIYNKISFALQEISGEKSPLEKEALDSKYYEWLNKPGMIKLPFHESPVYVNLGNMLPYYTMNILSPSERNYESRYGKVVSSAIDKLPIFDDPSGQILVDYFLMPSLLQDEIPQGAFGQRIYPANASLSEKVRALGTSVAEAYLPGYNYPVAGILGLGLPEEVLPYAPYKARKIGYAAEGKSALGISSRQNPTERVAHALSGLAGFPTYPVNIRTGK